MQLRCMRSVTGAEIGVDRMEKLASGQKLTARRQTINRALLPEQKTSGSDTESQGSSSGGCNASDKAAPLLLLLILLFSARKAIKNTKA